MFNFHQFLVDHFGTPTGVLHECSSLGVRAPGYETAQKWFQRRQVPGEWFPVLVCVAELLNGGPIRLAPYLGCKHASTD